jgi:hypothetical protein
MAAERVRNALAIMHFGPCLPLCAADPKEEGQVDKLCSAQEAVYSMREERLGAAISLEQVRQIPLRRTLGERSTSMRL